MKEFKNYRRALTEQKNRVKMRKTRAKGWITIGTAALMALGLSGTIDNQSVANADTFERDIANINYVKGYGVNVWKNVPAAKFTGQRMPVGSNWKTFGTKKGKGNLLFYNIGRNQFGDSKYLDLRKENSKQKLTGIVKVNYVPGYGINLWDSPYSNRTWSSRRRLPHNSRWKVSERRVVDGKTWYKVGTNQWAEGEFSFITVERFRGEKFFYGTGFGESDSNRLPGTNGNTEQPNTNKPVDPETSNPTGPDTDKKPVEPDTSNPTDPDGDKKPVDPNENQKPEKQMVTVTTKFVDEAEKEISESETKDVEINSDVTVKAIDITGYELVGEKTQSGTVSGDTTFTFTYKKKTTPVVPPVDNKEDGEVVVEARDSYDNSLIKQTTISGKVGDSFTAKPETIEGYALKPDQTEQTGTYTKDKQVITFKYGKVTSGLDMTTPSVYVDIQVIDVDTGEIIGGAGGVLPFPYKVGSTVTIDAPAVEGYDVLDKQVTKPIEQKVDEDGQTTYYNVIKIRAKKKSNTPNSDIAEVVLKGTGSGQEIVNKTLGDHKVGEKITVTAPKIEGYEVVGPDQIEHTVVSGVNNIEFTYIEIPKIYVRILASKEIIGDDGHVDYEDEFVNQLGPIDATLGEEKTITIKPEDYQGYELYDQSSASQTKTIHEGENWFTFVVKKA